jgi:hypothetical protein
MFKVNKSEWELFTAADRQAIRDWRDAHFAWMNTDAEDITLPSGLVFRIFADGRGFIKEGNPCTRTA